MEKSTSSFFLEYVCVCVCVMRILLKHPVYIRLSRSTCFIVRISDC